MKYRSIEENVSSVRVPNDDDREAELQPYHFDENTRILRKDSYSMMYY